MTSITPFSRLLARWHGRLVLLLALLLCVAQLPLTTEAMITSAALRNVRLGSTYTYTMYSGSTVVGESFVTGTTTYPYVFDSSMNTFVVKLLHGYLAYENKTVKDVGGSLKACMGSGGMDATGKTCYKALLAAVAPADCSTANILCCPLFWRVGGQNIDTKMAQLDMATIFWNGAYAVNGFFANFSQAYLMEHGNCSQPLFAGTTEINLAVDVTGEWRFVPLLTSYVLRETALNVNAAAGAAVYFGNQNPQRSISAAKKVQQPPYHVINHNFIPVVVCVVLLLATGVFLVAASACGMRRSTAKVRRAQLRLIELKSAPPAPDSVAILSEISPESSSSNSSDHSRRSKRQNAERHSATNDEHSGNDSFSSDDSDDRERRSGNADSFGDRDEATPPRCPSAIAKGSMKSLNSKGSAASKKQLKQEDSKKVGEGAFRPPPAPLPPIRRRNVSTPSDDVVTQAASAHMAKQPSYTGTVVHQVNIPPYADPSQKGWFRQ